MAKSNQKKTNEDLYGTLTVVQLKRRAYELATIKSFLDFNLQDIDRVLEEVTESIKKREEEEKILENVD